MSVSTIGHSGANNHLWLTLAKEYPNENVEWRAAAAYFSVYGDSIGLTSSYMRWYGYPLRCLSTAAEGSEHQKRAGFTA